MWMTSTAQAALPPLDDEPEDDELDDEEPDDADDALSPLEDLVASLLDESFDAESLLEESLAVDALDGVVFLPDSRESVL